MPSPFPGMDPFLEDAKLWPAFQHQLVACLYRILLPTLVDRFRARAGQRHYQSEMALFTSVLREDHTEEYIEVRPRGDSRLVALIEVVSPANKNTPEGRAAYLAKRQDAKSAGANLVEIDLVLSGTPTLDYSRDGLPEWDYAVTVTRASQPDRYEIYTATLQKRLPRFRLPLGSKENDTVVDLQAAFSSCYDQSGYGSQIDYAAEPPVRLEDDDRRWVDELLKQQKLRN